MQDTVSCHRSESSLNELLREPIIALMMTSDGVHSDDIRALFRRMEEKDKARGRVRSRELFERCLTP